MSKFIVKIVSFLLASAMLLAACGSKTTDESDHTSKRKKKTDTTVSSDNIQPDPTLPTNDYPTEEDPALEVTEVMIKNEIGVSAPDGKRHPWIELRAVRDVNLSDYSLVYAQKSIYALPDVSLKAGEYYLVFLYKDGFDITPDVSANLMLLHGEYLCQSFVYINRGVNCSYVVSEGSETSTPTPGYENALEADKLIISELMCDNSVYPVNGVLCDWIEVYNGGETDIQLSEYWASDKPDNPYLCQLPNVTLHAGEYYVLCCGNEITFGLSKSGETVFLTRRDGVTSSVITYESFDKNFSFTRESGACATPSPGYPNGEDGYYLYISSRGGLVINEVISSNSKYKKYNGDYYDIVEIYNGTGESVNLGEYFLSDKSKDLQRYQLPDVTLGAGKYQLVYCTGKGGSDPDFSISSKGENLYLTNSEGYVCDVLCVPELLHNISYGRYEGRFVYYETPSLGSANDESGFAEITAPPVADVVSGNYDSEVSVTISGDGEIYYTTDGSQPTTESKRYEGEPIVFDKPGNLRMICKKEAAIASKESAYTYFVSIPDYTLPIVMVAVDDEAMFGANGPYTKSSKKTELPAHVSYFEDGEEKFSVGCGIKLFGGTSVKYAKKSFQLKFRGKYGASELEYKIFDNLDIDSFNSLVLRAGGQAQYRSMIADEVGTSIAGLSGNMPSLLYQSYKACDLYVNDRYMGVYFIREKIDEHFIASHLGGEPEDATLISDFWSGSYSVSGVDGAEWKEIWNFVQKQDLTVPENYAYIQSVIDFDSLIDFYIMEMFVHNTDSGNLKICKTRYGDGKWHWILFDLDLAFLSQSSGAGTYLGALNIKSRPFNPVIYNLLKNEEFSAYFEERLMMHVSSTLSNETVKNRIDSVYNEIAHDMVYEIERWKDVSDPAGMARLKSVATWQSRVEVLYRRSTAEYLEQFVTEVKARLDKIRK